MLLSTPTETEELAIESIAPTAVEPGAAFTIRVAVVAHRRSELLAVEWVVPQGVTTGGPLADAGDGLPRALDSGTHYELKYAFSTAREYETFGQITGTLHFRPDGDGERSVSWSACIGVFPRAVARARRPLSDGLRHRLITAVNFDAANGHAFLVDFCAFFDDFCNVEVPMEIASKVSDELGLADQGLPLPAAQAPPDEAAPWVSDGPVFDDLQIINIRKQHYVNAVLGQTRIYGIERLELVPEEECNDSDGRFDLRAASDATEEFTEVEHG